MKNFSDNIFFVEPRAFTAAMADVPDTTSVFDDDSMLTARPVPHFEKEMYIPWGADDQLPYELIHLVNSDEVTAQDKFFNVLTCYGAGLHFKPLPPVAGAKDLQPDGEALVQLAEVNQWAVKQNLSSYFLEQATDMKFFFFAIAVVILSKDGTRINRVRHKEACYCRLAKADRYGHIPYVYYGNWRKGYGYTSEIERIPLLDERDPITDLLQKMGKEPSNDGRIHAPRKPRKYAILMRFPTAGCQYYPVPYWSSILRGGSYDEKRLISVGKRAKLRNHTSVKYQVEVEQNYWQKICREEFITDREKMVQRIKKEKENIRDFVAGLENSDKVWISSYYVNPDGKEVHDVKITRIDTSKEGGEWAEDIQAAVNTICYADNIHPNLVGAVPGKSQSNNSGSDKRELFTMKQALEIAFHDILLMPLRLVCVFNGWLKVEPFVPMIQLTTLDEHADSKKVAVKTKEASTE